MNDTIEQEISELDALKQEATELGITFSAKISAKALAERIEEHYNKASTDAAIATEAAADNVVESRETIQQRAELHMRTLARQAEAAARKTHVVTIIDNDQRVNNATTTCVVNCSNEYFDLGTIYLPLNEKVEVRQGHIEALLGVRIPQHVRSRTNAAMSETVMRPRYTIQYHNI